MLRNPFRLLIVVFLLCAAVPGYAQMSPEALSAIQRGKTSAQEHYYFSALRDFEDALRLAPDAPEIYGYLGLTESKIGGRELRAIAWYGAYLAANPKAPNATRVSDAISELLSANESKMALTIQTWETAVMSMPDSADRGPYTNGFRRDFALENVGTWYASYGSLADARRIAGLIPDAHMSEIVLAEIIGRQLSEGDVEGAKRTNKMIHDATCKEIAKEKFEGAKTTSEAVNEGGSISDWTRLVDELDKDVFTDTTKALHTDSSEPRDVVAQFAYVANNLGYMQKKIKRMLVAQAKLRGAS